MQDSASAIKKQRGREGHEIRIRREHSAMTKLGFYKKCS
jgi:hypothetical protein